MCDARGGRHKPEEHAYANADAKILHVRAPLEGLAGRRNAAAARGADAGRRSAVCLDLQFPPCSS